MPFAFRPLSTQRPIPNSVGGKLDHNRARPIAIDTDADTPLDVIQSGCNADSKANIGHCFFEFFGRRFFHAEDYEFGVKPRPLKDLKSLLFLTPLGRQHDSRERLLARQIQPVD